jgi:hypothetical protein
MTDKKVANLQARDKKSTRLYSTNSTAQRARLLKRLQLGPVDTFCIMRELNICRPSARISELRGAGLDIRTHRVSTTDDQGRTHHGIALYYLTQTGE